MGAVAQVDWRTGGARDRGGRADPEWVRRTSRERISCRSTPQLGGRALGSAEPHGVKAAAWQNAQVASS